MSNILVIKHGSLGDIVQISGALQDIKENHKNNKIFLLTTQQYVELLAKCPYLDGVMIDKRLPRWNIFYLIKLKKLLGKFMFTHVYDLQNSSRTFFYRKYLLNIPIWSSTQTTLKKSEKKKDFDTASVLERFAAQLEHSNIRTNHTLKPDFSWALVNIDKMVNKYFAKKFILLFPFCSPKLSHKKWPHFNDLIKLIRKKHNRFEIAIAPGPNEIEAAKKINATSITNAGKSLNIMELASLIKKSSFVISNDTGPAHMTAHLRQGGKVLFGRHTTAEKVSIETEKFKAITVEDLNMLTPDQVYADIKNDLELIN